MRIKVYDEDCLIFSGEAENFYYLGDCNEELQEILDSFESSKVRIDLLLYILII